MPQIQRATGEDQELAFLQGITGATALGVKKNATVPPCGIVGAPHGPQMETWVRQRSGFGVLCIEKHQGSGVAKVQNY